MAQIKIISNPYLKRVIYECYDDKLGKYIEINYENNPNCKLIGEDYRSTYFVFNINDILGTIYDTYYNKAEKLKITFSGTKEEYKALVKAINQYGSDIALKEDDKFLEKEDIVLDTLESIKNRLGLHIELKVNDNEYERIYNIINLVNKYYDDINVELEATNINFNSLNSQHDSNVNILIEAVKKQNESRIEYIKNKKDIKKIFDEYIKNYVINKKIMEEEYDRIKDEVLNSIKTNDNNLNENCNKVDKNDKCDDKINKKATNNNKLIHAKFLFNFLKDRVNDLANDIDANGKADKLFMSYMNELYNDSFNKLAEEIKNKYYLAMCERERCLKNDVLDVISKCSDGINKNSIEQVLSTLPLANETMFSINEIKEHKFKNIDVVVHLPGVPNVWGIRNEWATELKKFIAEIHNKFDIIKNETFNHWEEKIIKELKDNIVKLNPNVKEEVNNIVELNNKKNNLEAKLELAKQCKEEIDSIISYIM